MPGLTRPARFPVRVYDEGAYRALCLDLHEKDAMYKGNDSHYLRVGATALNCVRAAQNLALVPAFGSILDFGSGAGRVSRWLRAAFPQSAITCADIRAGDLQFCATAFGARTWNSGIDIDAMRAPDAYDLIWVGSVLTHLSEEKSKKLLARFLEWSRPGGLVLASFHGRHAYSKKKIAAHLTPEQMASIEAQYETAGYGYHDYPKQTGYGYSYAKPAWFISAIGDLACKLVFVSERAWDLHHDVIAIQKQE